MKGPLIAYSQIGYENHDWAALRRESTGTELSFNNVWVDPMLPQHKETDMDAERATAIIFDLDGVLADKHDGRGWFDYGDVKNDIPNIPMMRALGRLSFAYRAAISAGCRAPVTPVIVTGRERWSKPYTKDWLSAELGALGLTYDGVHLRMRPDGNRQPASELKEQILIERVIPEYDVALAFDDDPEVIEMYRRHGIAALQVQFGKQYATARSACQCIRDCCWMQLQEDLKKEEAANDA